MTPVTPMTKLPTEDEEVIEEALGEILEAFESGQRRRLDIEPMLDARVRQSVLQELASRRLVEMKGDQIAFTVDGERVANALLRRKRLAERLLKDVLSVKEELIDPTVCQWEHIISKEVADSICTLLGHPRQSPHNRPIPPGECCKSAATRIAPVVQPLSKIAAGEKAKISYLMIKQNAELDRLLSLGLVPGTVVEVLQRFPTFVVQANEAQLAFDESIADGVFVHPLLPRS
jgi:DtxR family Mn-dependent transcriptional regulator